MGAASAAGPAQVWEGRHYEFAYKGRLTYMQRVRRFRVELGELVTLQ